MQYYLLQNTEATQEGGFDSKAFKPERPATRPKSRAASRISMGSNDENVNKTIKNGKEKENILKLRFSFAPV